MHTFIPKGVCSREITFDVKDGRITGLRFTRGCDGNLKAISRLVEGMKIEEAITRLEGIHCGDKSTSCADQLSLALKSYLSR